MWIIQIESELFNSLNAMATISVGFPRQLWGTSARANQHWAVPRDAWVFWTDVPWVEKYTVYPKKYAHGFVVLCFVVVIQSFIMNSHEVFIHIHQGCFAGTGAIVRLPQCQWSKPDGYGKISQCITTTKHSKAKTVCIFLGIYCRPYDIGLIFYNLIIDLYTSSHQFRMISTNISLSCLSTLHGISWK